MLCIYILTYFNAQRVGLRPAVIDLVKYKRVDIISQVLVWGLFQRYGRNDVPEEKQVVNWEQMDMDTNITEMGIMETANR